MQYQIRTARDEDLEILDRIYTENMKGYVEKVYPWNDEIFGNNFVSQEYQVIEMQTQPVGFIKTIASITDIYIAEIQIASQYQNFGIGTALIQSVINQSVVNNQRIWLKLVKGNPAEKLYRRLSFAIFEESNTHKKMEIRPIHSNHPT